MRMYAAFVALAFVACGSSNGSGSGSDGGTPSPCTSIADQLCQMAATCSAGGSDGVVFVVGSDADTGVHSYDVTVDRESGCEVLVGAACNGGSATAFTASCGSAINSGLSCGPSVDDHGNGLLIPAACWQNI